MNNYISFFQMVNVTMGLTLAEVKLVDTAFSY